MAYLTASGRLIEADSLAGDSFLNYLDASVVQRDRDEDGSGLGKGGETIYHLTVYGTAAERLDRAARAGQRPLLVFGGRYAVRHLDDGTVRHEVSVDYIGLDLDAGVG